MVFEKNADRKWKKEPANPVLGGELGVCFDLCLLEENGCFRMWFSWRTQKSIALTESTDGIHWSKPVICIAPSGWEDEVNRPSVVYHDNCYHMSVSYTHL